MKKFGLLVKGLLAGTIAGAGLFAVSKALQQKDEIIYGPVDTLKGTGRLVLIDVTNTLNIPMTMHGINSEEAFDEDIACGVNRIVGKIKKLGRYDST